MLPSASRQPGGRQGTHYTAQVGLDDLAKRAGEWRALGAPSS